ncbi:hypothetical protein [Leptolyngbya sp. FACHB-321]|uniref:hypothetical protein n=1 Tax=Leptolyngbya sp. FACHB-321 TaxID=2692807 RepID=UPI00168557E4|nr:hypothetical protein [Leptolyngbya sp. FACHB-321]
MGLNFFDPRWGIGREAVAASRLWRYSLIAIGSASSLIYPHVPLVSFAALAGITLHRKQAVVSVALIWFVNQVYGFALRDYPLSPIALLWGVTMGLGTVAVVLLASMQPKFSDRGWLGQTLWLGVVMLLGFGIAQSSILFVNQWVGMHGFTADVLLRLFMRELVWAIALFTLYTAFVLNHQRSLRHTLR